MDRNIPHVLDIFMSSPGERRRMLAKSREEQQISNGLKDQKNQQKNPRSDSAVCLCSSSDEDEKNISKYFEYLDDVEPNLSPKKKKNGKENKEPEKTRSDNQKQKKIEPENDIKHIERHLSMKKTIRKKMMRDLQQAFVEDPKEFQQDPECIPADRKSNINIQNLTISKRKMSKSEHSFLEMLKESELKERKRNLKGDHKPSPAKKEIKIKQSGNDSGHDSPTGDSPVNSKVNLSKPDSKEEKKSLWQRITGIGKSKR